MDTRGGEEDWEREQAPPRIGSRVSAISDIGILLEKNRSRGGAISKKSATSLWTRGNWAGRKGKELPNARR